MGTGNAQTFYYKVKYDPITIEGYSDYKYIALFKVESCWNIEDGREAVKNWCTKNIKDYNKFDGNRYPNSIIYEIHKKYYENCDAQYDTINKDIKLVELKGTYVKPKEIDYEYNPTKDQMKVTNNFFENIDNKVSLWNTPPDTVLYRTDSTSTAANKAKWNTTGVNEAKWNTTGADTTEWYLKDNTENNIKLYDTCVGTLCNNKDVGSFISNANTTNANTAKLFTSNTNPPEYSKDNKEYENLMLM